MIPAAWLILIAILCLIPYAIATTVLFYACCVVSGRVGDDSQQ